mmetsp:Transcript_17044/g.23986  ORF Transcript_17044/g.23986 Transcript_17044/m.23986 type:complete len:816 (+) Transcript_17044:43-2490(+)
MSSAKTMSSSMGQNTGQTTEKAVLDEKRKEVDYYLNPTELFRWINYRRWDGAKARVLSHPEECETWIVSRHSSDGRILWRHLPLHLVCMQSEAGAAESSQPSSSQASRQIEELIDILLDAYPEGASSPDDQGMLPLHLTVANSTQPNERIINLLLMAYPTAVEVKDNYGRTPADLLNSKAESGPHREAALRAMARAQHTTSRLVEALREENVSIVSNVKQTASNERMASQRIIMRLEEELVEARSQIEDLEKRSDSKEDNLVDLRDEIQNLQNKLTRENENIQSLRNERDELINQTEILRHQVEDHENAVQKIQQSFEDEQQDQADTIANLKSEASTSKAMAEALEAQLRSRFTNEEYLTNTVSELETELADLKNEYQQEKKKLVHERDTYMNENTQLNRSVEEFKKKNSVLQTKLLELNKQMTGILSSNGALNAEHDRMLEAALRTETELAEGIRNERAQTLSTMEKQWEFFESVMKDHRRMMEDFQHKENELLDAAKEERERSQDSIAKMRVEFRDARANAAERQRILQSEAVLAAAASRNLTRGSSGSSTGSNSSGRSGKSERKQSSESMSSSQKTRRAAGRVQDSSNQKNDGNSSSSGSSRHPRSVQANTSAQVRDGSLLNLLEVRAGQGSGRSRVSSSNASSTYVSSESSVLTPSLRRGVVGQSDPQQKPRMVNVSNSGNSGQQRTVNFAQDNKSVNSTSPRSRISNSSSRSSSNGSIDIRGQTSRNRTPSVNYDEYSITSSTSGRSAGDSESEVSSRGDSAYRKAQQSSKSSQFSGMAAGLRMGMIRIAEERSEADSQYSRGSDRDSQY